MAGHVWLSSAMIEHLVVDLVKDHHRRVLGVSQRVELRKHACEFASVQGEGKAGVQVCRCGGVEVGCVEVWMFFMCGCVLMCVCVCSRGRAVVVGTLRGVATRLQ